MQTTAKSTKKASGKNKWSAAVTRNSHALDLKENVFKLTSAKKIAESLKQAAEKSNHKKSTPYQSAMSMLDFYINRAGKNLSPTQKKRLALAKIKLQHAFHREIPKEENKA
jgi:ABC-type transport system involved in cytochrome bd biosynthesis fused ATPase/permease subunit